MDNKKRKRSADGEEDEVDHDASHSDVQLKKTTREGKAKSKPKTARKPKYNNTGDEPLPTVIMNPEGNGYVDLGKKKRATVRSFKGQVFVDIREFYGIDGDEKPSKKGISLAAEQWEVLKQSISTLDSLVAAQSKH